MTAPDLSTTTLIVPMQIDALVINEPIHDGGKTWNRWEMDYNQLNRFLNPMPMPFTSDTLTVPDIGIHVHWALPDGLTHGTPDPDDPGGFVYPYLPNRWLVVRMMTDPTAPATPPVISAWVIAADAIGQPDGARYLNPAHDPAGTDPVRQITLGTSMTLAAWQAQAGTGTPPPPFLTALAPGNISFAGFAPGNRNVLSFLDPLDGIDSGTISYQVFGWYTDPAADPLTGRTLKDGWTTGTDAGGAPILIATALDWSVPALDGVAPPSVTAVSGLVHGVTWDRQTGSFDPATYPTDVSSRVRIAVGATAEDALAALIREQAMAAGVPADTATLEADLLEAFQADMLREAETPGGQETVLRKLHDAAFSRSAGGYRWSIVPVEQADPGDPSPAPRPTPAQEAWLAKLNANQAVLDRQSRVLDTMQQELANLWWKAGRIPFAPEPSGEPQRSGFDTAKQYLPAQIDPSVPGSWAARTAAQAAAVDAARATVPIPAGPDSAASIAQFSAVHLDPSVFQLKPEPAPRFHAPADPVMLISGLGRSERFGHDGQLPCRRPCDLVTGLTVAGTTLTTASMPAGAVPQLDATGLPELANTLVVETYWLNPADAATIADKGLNSTDAGVIAAIAADLQAVPPQNIVGTPPAPRGNTAWSQPWLPLYLEWSTDFFYSFQTEGSGSFVPDANGDYQFDRTHWAFDGSDYDWTGGPLDTRHAVRLTGRTVLTPHGSFTFLNRLKDYLARNPDADLQNVEQILEKLADFDILSQTLTGLTAQLAMIDTDPNLSPPDDLADLIGPGADRGVPFLGLVQDEDRRFGGGTPFFFPIRAGFLQMADLRITDSYGRTARLNAANGNFDGDIKSFQPIQGRGMAPDPAQVGPAAAKVLLRLDPRFAQPARLDFTWISAEDDADPVAITGGATPVCGWLLANHLDRSLAVYDADGACLGEVLTVLIAPGQDRIIWVPAPGDPATSPVVAPQATPRIANAHLAAIVTRLLAQADGPAALATFLRAIDETLWTVSPAAARADRDLDTLMGRPVAVTRVNIAMTLRGEAWTDQAFYKTFKGDTDTLLRDPGSLEAFTWPVRFGSQAMRHDGTIGYFAGDDYSRFNAVHLPDNATTSPYVRKIGTGNYVDLPLRPEPQLASPPPFDATGSQYLTLLLDPNGSVNMATGLLPSVEVTLSDRHIDRAADTMATTVRVGPLVLDADAVRIPAPSVTSGDWTWLYATGTATGDWRTDPIAPADTAPHFDAAPPILREGWLRFVPDTT